MKEKRKVATGQLIEEMIADDLLGGFQEIPSLNIISNWFDINFDELEVFDFGDTVIKDVGNTEDS